MNSYLPMTFAAASAVVPQMCGPSAPPVDQEVMFVSNAGADQWDPNGYDLYITDLAGSYLKRYETPDSSEFSPEWSPGAESHAFTIRTTTDTGSTRFELGIRHRPSGIVTVHSPYMPIVASPSWSPRGTMIVFAGGAGVGQSELYVMHPVQGVPHQITHLNSGASAPKWHTDGWIYFGSPKSGVWEVWRVRPNGADAQKLTTGSGLVGAVTAGPQGVVYTSAFVGQPPRIKLWTLTGTTELAIGWEPSLDPRGRYLAFARGASDPNVVLLDLTTGAETEVSAFEGSIEGMPEVGP